MVYYGFIAFALYFVLYLFYLRALRLKKALVLSEYEIALTRWQKSRLIIMFSVPLLSILLTLFVKSISPVYASMAGGLTYFLYTPLIFLWYRKEGQETRSFPQSGRQLVPEWVYRLSGISVSLFPVRRLTALAMAAPIGPRGGSPTGKGISAP